MNLLLSLIASHKDVFQANKHRKKKDFVPFLLPIHTFSLNLHQFCATAVDYAEGLLNKKVLLKLSSSLKLRNFDIDTKMIAVAPHHLIYTYLYRSGYCQFGVGYCFIRVKGNAKARVWDKADIVPTPYLLY